MGRGRRRIRDRTRVVASEDPAFREAEHQRLVRRIRARRDRALGLQAGSMVHEEGAGGLADYASWLQGCRRARLAGMAGFAKPFEH